MQTIFECDAFSLRHSPHPGKVGYVTFTSWGQTAKDPGFAEKLLSPKAIPAFYFVSKSNHWWQVAEMPTAAAMVQALKQAQGIERLVAYGGSMGGYGAARWGVACGANAHLLIAPQFTIDPNKAPHESRWKAEAREIDFAFDDMRAAFSDARDATIIYDPWSEDRAHIDLFRTCNRFNELTLPFCGHVPAIVLNETKCLSELALAYLEAPPDQAFLASIRAQMRERRGNSPRYLHELATAARIRHPRWTYRLQHRAMASNPDSLVIILQAIDAAFLAQEFEDVTRLILRAIAIAPDHAAPWRAMYRWMRHQGETGAALEAAQQAQKRRPDSGDLNRVLTQALIDARQPEAALKVAEKAVAIDPEYAGGWQLKAQLHEQLGQFVHAMNSYMKARDFGTTSPAQDKKIVTLLRMVSAVAK